jgi:hypothetical protein
MVIKMLVKMREKEYLQTALIGQALNDVEVKDIGVGRRGSICI